MKVLYRLYTDPDNSDYSEMFPNREDLEDRRKHLAAARALQGWSGGYQGEYDDMDVSVTSFVPVYTVKRGKTRVPVIILFELGDGRALVKDELSNHTFKAKMCNLKETKRFVWHEMFE